jgi:hypothetical protein
LLHHDVGHHHAERDGEVGQSTFVSPGGEIGFGFTVPPRASGSDVFFTIRVPVGVSWGAVGLGSIIMDRSLVLMIYLNEAGNNVTFSPRYGQGHFEPAWLDEVSVEVLDGTGIISQRDTDYMMYRARCKSGCRSWHNGFLDVTSREVEAIYAFGPSDVTLQSDDQAAPLLMHVEVGQFTIDMKRTEGASDAPLVDDEASNDGVDPEDDVRQTGMRDGGAIAHGVLMLVGTSVLLPIGVALLFKQGFAAHAAVQLAALACILAGFGVGVSMSFRYQRSRSFNSQHQILGFIVIAGLLVQPVLGYLHHRQYMRTSHRGRLSLAHRWIGRIVMLLGFLNGLLGFSMAQNYLGGKIYSALILFFGLCLLGFRVFLEMRRRQWQKRNGGAGAGLAADMDQQPSWRQNVPPGPANYNDDVPATQPSGIGLMPVSPMGNAGNLPARSNRMDLGQMQQPREFM